MAKAGKKSKPVEKDPPELGFEQSLSELQQIVDDLETGQLGLDDSMQRFEQGVSLLRSCYKTLETAEQKIEILTGRDANGNPQTEAFDATSTLQQKQTSAGRRKRTTKKKPDKTETAEEGDSEPGKRLF